MFTLNRMGDEETHSNGDHKFNSNRNVIGDRQEKRCMTKDVVLP